MTESIPPEGQQPLTQAQIRQLRRDLTEQMLDRAESDPEWRQLFLDDPELAMREANFPAAQQLEEQGPLRYLREREVVGQGQNYHGGLFTPKQAKRARFYGRYGEWHCSSFTQYWSPYWDSAPYYPPLH